MCELEQSIFVQQNPEAQLYAANPQIAWIWHKWTHNETDMTDLHMQAIEEGEVWLDLDIKILDWKFIALTMDVGVQYQLAQCVDFSAQFVD